MSQFEKLLERMRNNPGGDWDIDDIERVCSGVPDTQLHAPKRGSHYTVSHPKLRDILTIPAKRPLKGVYVKRFVSMMDSIIEEGDDVGGADDPSVAG
jgi:hypothetical protein